MKTVSSKGKIGGVTFTIKIGVILLAGLLNTQAGLTFLSKTYAVGHAPNCVTAADVNGDSSLDLICANYADNTLTVLTNSGSGSFGSNATFKVGIGPASVIAADIRRSGKVDLVCANYGAGGGKTVTILTNNGNGGFGSNATLTVGIGPYWVIAADLKGAGQLDLVTANIGTNGNGNTLTILTNSVFGVFGSNASLTVGSYPISVTAADVNSDGKMDLISANDSGNSLTVLTNKGNGQFGSNATLNVTAPTCVTANDVNGDGKPDLISASFYPSVLTVFTNNSHGGFGAKPALPLGSLTRGPIFPQSVSTADLNGDGRPDLICANTTNVLSGVGAFVIFTNNASYQFGSNATINVGAFSVCVVAADVNADGKPDLISANQSANTLTVLINTNIFPSPAFVPALSYNLQSNAMSVSWPSVSPGWSLEETHDVINTNWLPSGYGGYAIADDGTNKNLTLPMQSGNHFFRLIHP